MKAKKLLKDTAFYGLAVPGAAVLDTAITTVAVVGVAIASIVKTPFTSVKSMTGLRKLRAQINDPASY